MISAGGSEIWTRIWPVLVVNIACVFQSTCTCGLRGADAASEEVALHLPCYGTNTGEDLRFWALFQWACALCPAER